MKQFVLVHGMSHGAWVWDLLAVRLSRDGHAVLALDLPGHGRRAHERARASMDGYARAVAGAMALAGVHCATLVGHSMGGPVIQRAAELVSARIDRLVFLAAVVLPDGGSFAENHLPPSVTVLMRGLAAAGGGVVQLPAEIEHSRWMNDLPAGDPRVVDALARLTPQPLRPLVERVDLRRFYALGLPRTYIRCLRDLAVTAPKATEYARRLGVTPIDLDTAHNPMLSAPDELARILETL
jgi:pimeloyl-ACP methyl ester carboxylesterase